MDTRVPALIERANHLKQIIIHLQGDAAIVHDSNKYLGNLEFCLRDFENEESLQRKVTVQRRHRRDYTEEDAIKEFEFRLERAAIAIENYINKGQFNCGYWHPLTGD